MNPRFTLCGVCVCVRTRVCMYVCVCVDGYGVCTGSFYRKECMAAQLDEWETSIHCNWQCKQQTQHSKCCQTLSCNMSERLWHVASVF